LIKVQLFSDLHVDWSSPRPIEVGVGVDVVVVPGDVAEGAQNAFVALRRIVPSSIPIVFVMGNHEYYKRFFAEELARARAVAPDFNVLLLENDVVTFEAIGGNRGKPIRFVGASCWTDYRLFGEVRRLAAMAEARERMNDHRRIGWRRLAWERFRPQEAAMLHYQSKEFIAQAIAVEHDGPTIVVTHHGVDLLSVPERWKSDLLTSAYASTIGRDVLVRRPNEQGLAPPRVDYWFHGHVHARADFLIGATRVMANPHGYGDEVAAFDPRLIVEIDTDAAK
jgi:predicted MPP superfamily phosphohydrolase